MEVLDSVDLATLNRCAPLWVLPDSDYLHPEGRGPSGEFRPYGTEAEYHVSQPLDLHPRSPFPNPLLHLSVFLDHSFRDCE